MLLTAAKRDVVNVHNARTGRRRLPAAVATLAVSISGVTGAQPGYPQTTYPQQQTSPQQIYPQQPAYPQPTYPQTYPQQQTSPQQTYPQQPAYPQPTYPQTTYPQTTYPQQQTSPQQTYPQPTYPAQTPGNYTSPVTTATPSTYAPAQGSAQGSPLRNVFANTVGAVLMATGTGLVAGLVGAIGGSIVDWFSRKPDRNSAGTTAATSTTVTSTASYPANTYPGASTPPATAYGTTGAATTYPSTTYPNTSYPTAGNTSYPPTTTYPSTTYPPAASVTTVPPAGGSATPPTYPTSYPPAAYPPTPAGSNGVSPSEMYPYPSATQPANGSTGYPATAVPSSTTGLYAGLAYEVYALTTGGAGSVVDPNTYIFRSGDKFLVHLRPSLPGRLEIYNINASGKKTRIDSTPIAAGELTTLGPYQFAAEPGEETLKIVLTACATPELLTRTRDIVNVSSTAGGAPAVHLSACGTATRALVETRDIQKVAAEGPTSFALDPIATNELASGDFAPREVTITFHHR